jgi:P27 family predicted phage terminase small subunit
MTIKVQTRVRLLHSRSKTANKSDQREATVTVMPERKAKPKGLKEIACSQYKPPEGNETKPVVILECPSELGPLARQEWDRIVGELTSLGVLSVFDRGPLAAYCNAYALWIDATEAVQKYGAMIKSPNGYPTQSPYLATVNRQAEIMLRIASEFGFTPASRSRIFSFAKSNSMLLENVDRSDDGSTKW